MTTISKPIRVALIGLSASASGTGWAASAHLPYLLKSPQHYTITALLNTSVENARSAINAYGLPSNTKAYGNPEDLAADPDIDLVVANTRVDKHAAVLLPSLKAGKAVFSEWPLDRNGAVAQEMVAAARHGGAKTITGLQARFSPVVRKIKEIVASGRIGKVLSSTVVASAGNGGAEESVKIEYFGDKEVGGNMLSIHFAHLIDGVFFALGEPVQLNTVLATQRPNVKIIDKSTSPPTYLRTIPKNTPDQVLLNGTLDSGAVLSLHVRGGPPIPQSENGKGVPPFVWRIYGEKGEIEVTGQSMIINVATEQSVRLHDHESGKVEDVALDQGGKFWEDLPVPARNIGRVYEAFATGGLEGGDKRLVRFEDALKRHKLIDEILRRWDAGDQGWSVELYVRVQ